MKKTTKTARASAAKRRGKAAGTRGRAAAPRKPARGAARRAGTAVPGAKAKVKAKAGTKAKAKAKPAKASAQATPARSADVARAEQTISQLKAELAEVRRRIGELQSSAETDFLLDVLNRRGFERELSRSIAYIKRYHATGAVIMLDVDRLKPINDTFGHAAGDEVLKAVATTLAAMVRASDVVGRLGGDEFAVLLWNLNETDARAKAQALERAVDSLSFSFDGRTVIAGASAGIAILGQHTDTRRALEEADRAMYVRKAQRRHEMKTANA